MSDTPPSTDPETGGLNDHLVPVEPTPTETDAEASPSDVMASTTDEDADANIAPSVQRIAFDMTSVDMRGTPRDVIEELLYRAEDELGQAALDGDVRTIGSWANILFRQRTDPDYEEIRSQKALASFTQAEREQLLAAIEKDGRLQFTSSELKDAEGKVILNTAKLGTALKAGESKHLSGKDALLAFAMDDRPGGYRIPLYNSGICIDLLVPTGLDFDTMLSNCRMHDGEMGSELGAHYFTYNDAVYKTHLINFLSPLVIGSSFVEWRKKDRLFNIIKIPDLAAIVATIASICYPEGFDNFSTACKRPKSEEHPHLCTETETFKADISKMIITRYASMSPAAIEHMAAARIANATHTAAQIAKYQAELGYEGEQITIDNFTFTMKIPSCAEHLEASAIFFADIQNEVSADNTQGREEHIGVRYMRTFQPWIGTVAVTRPDGSMPITDDKKVIARVLEQLDHRVAGNEVRERFEAFIGRAQLTYVGHPITPCRACGYVAETPSGMWTFDPFTAFFTLAFLYSRQSGYSPTPTASPNT